MTQVMDAVVAKLSAQQVYTLAGSLMFIVGVVALGVAWAVRSAVVGFAYYKYRAKKRRPTLLTYEPHLSPAEANVAPAATRTSQELQVASA